jgi:hypothetical protein
LAAKSKGTEWKGENEKVESTGVGAFSKLLVLEEKMMKM